ncbi:MAG: hypothetical protein IT503_15485, partial [Burkholderiaceae bacterium]|nr:hypothetical protein [Burkholderiaceae bacterium]
LEQALGERFHVAPNGLGQLNGAYGAAYLGLRRVEKLLAEGKPIPPTAAQQGLTQGGPTTVRRWSAMAATRKRFEPCDTGSCSTGGSVMMMPKSTKASRTEQASA